MNLLAVFTRPRLQPVFDFTLATLAVLALFFALTVHGYESSFYRQIVALSLLLSLIIIKLFRSYHTELSLPSHPFFLWFLAFAAWIALSIAWSPMPEQGFLIMLTFSCGLFAILLSFWATERQWLYFRRLLIPLALLVVAMTSFQAFVLKIERPAGFLLNWNTNSAFLGAILLPYCAVYLRQIVQGWKPVLLGLFLASCAFGMALGQGRGSLFALAIGLALLFMAYRNEQRAYWGIALTLAWVAGGYALADVLHGGLLAQRLAAVSTPEGITDLNTLGSGREYLWSAGWHMYLDRPWLGWGMGMYHWLYPRYRPALHVEEGHYVHNDYLQFLIELGPIGLLLCLAWLAALIWLGWRLFRFAQAADQRFTDLGLSLACLSLLLHAGVDFLLYQSPMLILLGAYAGRLGWRYSQLSKTGILSIPMREKFTVAGYFSILTALTLFLAVGLYNLAIGFRMMGDVDLSRPPLEVFQEYGKVQRILPFIKQFQLNQGWYILSLIQKEPDRLPLAERDPLIHYAMDRFDQASQSNPYIALIGKCQAELLMLLPGQPVEIVRHLRQSLAIDPYQLDTRLELANALETAGDSALARDVLADGLNRAYIIDDIKQVRAFWRKIDGLIDDTAANAPQKQAILLEMQKLDDLKHVPGERFAFTLPDIGWKP